MADYLLSTLAFLQWFALDLTVMRVADRYWIGFLAALGCFLLVTFFFVRDVSGKGGNPRLFTVLALFAAMWALAASSYHAPPYPADTARAVSASAFHHHDAAGDLASFLAVFVGSLLAREGKEPDRFLSSQRLQVYALVLLGALVVPAYLAPRLDDMALVQNERFEIAVAGALALMGFYSLGVGGKAVASPEQYRWLFWILVAYSLLTVVRHAQLIAAVPGRVPSSDFLVLSFATAKILLTLTFGLIVVRHHERG